MKAAPAKPSKDDEAVTDNPHEVVRRGVEPARVKFGEIGSWKELRKIYADSFGPLLKDLADRAAPSWDIDALVEKFGEGVMTGTTHRVALLERDAMVEVSGEAADLVKVSPLETQGLTGAIALQIADEKLGQDMPFDVHIAYRSGGREHLKFFAVSPSTPSNRKPDGGLSMFED